MLYPRVQTVSQKGQMILPSDMRQLFKIKAGTLVLVSADVQNQEIIVKPMGETDPIEAGLGMLAGGKSLTKALLVEKKKERELEDKKYARSLRS